MDFTPLSTVSWSMLTDKMVEKVGMTKSPVSLSGLVLVTCMAAGGLTPAPMHSRREKSVYQSSLQWMFAALVLSSSCKPYATSRLTLDRTWGFIINSKRRERRTYPERGRKLVISFSVLLISVVTANTTTVCTLRVCTCEPMSSLRNKRIASLSNPTTDLSTKKQLSLAWTHNWYRWSRTVCHTHDTRSLQTVISL